MKPFQGVDYYQTGDLLNIDERNVRDTIRRWVEEAGFAGPVEVEIFSHRYWAMDQDEYLALVVKAYREHV